MRLSIVSKRERELLSKIEESNDLDVSVWRLSNVAIPIITISLSMILAFIFKSASKTIITVVNLLLTGSIPMMALNRLGSSGIYLFKYDKGKEKKYGISDTYILRTKLLLSFILISVFAVALYIYQLMEYPFSLEWKVLYSLVPSILTVFFSTKLSKQIYLLQDKLIDTTFDQTIRGEIEENGHGKNW